MKTVGTGGLAGGPVDAGPVDLPTEPRTTDLDAYRARIEAKRQQRRTQISALLLAGRPTLTTPPTPVPEPEDGEEPLVWDRDEDDDEPTSAHDAQQPDDDQPELAEQDTDPAPPPRRGRPVRVLTADEVERIVTQYQAGKGMTAIAGEVHVGVDRVRDVLRDAGVELRPGGRRGQVLAAQARGETPRLGGRAKSPALGADMVARMAAAYLRGDTLRVIAARERVARVRVRDALADAGVKMREKGRRPHPQTSVERMVEELDRVTDAEQESHVHQHESDEAAGGPGEQVSVEGAVLAGVPPLLAAEAVATVALDREDGTQVVGDPVVDVAEAAEVEIQVVTTDGNWPPVTSGGHGNRPPAAYWYPPRRTRGRHRADVDHANPPGDFLLALAAFIRDAEHLLAQGRRLQASLEPTPTKEPTE